MILLNHKKKLFTSFFVILIILTIAGIEELHYVHPKELMLNQQLVKSVRCLSAGADFKKVQTDFEELAKSVGMDDVMISVEGENFYGRVATLNVSGNIEAKTISRKIINRTKIPYQAKIEVPINNWKNSPI